MKRSQLLSKNALEVWKYQYMDELVLEKYKKVDIKADEIIYTFDDHPYIKESHQDIFSLDAIPAVSCLGLQRTPGIPKIHL